MMVKVLELYYGLSSKRIVADYDASKGGHGICYKKCFE